MSYYKMGQSFVWFVGRVSDIKDPEKLGRVKVRVIHGQTGELGKQESSYGIVNEDLLWAWPISAIQSASLNWRKIADDSHPLEGFDVPEWVGAVGMSPTGIAVGTYVYGFYLDGHEQNIPMIFGTYHKKSVHPEPISQSKQNTMLQLKAPDSPFGYFSDVAPLARGEDDEGKTGQTLPKHRYQTNKLWTNTTGPNNIGPVDEMPSAYNTKYPYNTTYTTKSGHAIEIDDTPGHERIHIWHRSGSYEEISNGRPGNRDENKDYPLFGPNEYKYRTASGVEETDFIGRRSLKTVDSFFETTTKDKNQLIGRDRNVEVANTETVKIGTTVHWTVGHQTPPPNRINTPTSKYSDGGIDRGNSFYDVLNNSITTVGNNKVLQIGRTPQNERRLSAEDLSNYYVDVANNHTRTIGSDHSVVVGNNQTVIIDNDSVTVIGRRSTITVDENCDIFVKGVTTINADSNIKINAAAGVNIKGEVVVEKDHNLRCLEYPSGVIVGVNGVTATVTNGLITDLK